MRASGLVGHKTEKGEKCAFSKQKCQKKKLGGGGVCGFETPKGLRIFQTKKIKHVYRFTSITFSTSALPYFKGETYQV